MPVVGSFSVFSGCFQIAPSKPIIGPMPVGHGLMENTGRVQLTMLALILVGGNFSLAAVADPISGLLGQPPVPDLCDDDNIVSPPDTFKFVEKGRPSEPALAVVMAADDVNYLALEDAEILTGQEDSNNLGVMSYRWEIWECKDYSYDDEAAFYVYRYGAAFDSFTYDISDDATALYYATPTIFGYKCGLEVGPCAFVDRPSALAAARAVANTMPTYQSPEATLHVADQLFEGTMSVRGSPVDMFSNLIFTGCVGSSAACYQIHVVQI